MPDIHLDMRAEARRVRAEYLDQLFAKFKRERAAKNTAIRVALHVPRSVAPPAAPVTAADREIERVRAAALARIAAEDRVKAAAEAARAAEERESDATVEMILTAMDAARGQNAAPTIGE